VYRYRPVAPTQTDEQALPASLDVTADGIEGLLVEFLRSRLDADRVEIESLRKTSSGFSRENWLFDAHVTGAEGEQRLHLILRRDPPASLIEADRRVEFETLCALAGTDLPVPPVRWLDEKGEFFGAPSLIMDRVDGDVDWFMLNGARPPEVRLDLARGFLRLLVQMQNVDCSATGLRDVLDDSGASATAALNDWERRLRECELEPTPELEAALLWLRQTAPTSTDEVLVHGDFKMGNTIVRDDRIVALLDWETAHMGDPLEDLGWITNPLRSREQQIEGVWNRAEIVAEYSRLTGREVD
jgi:aminoglycoside phosphotransferase (APT) family kinase protein